MPKVSVSVKKRVEEFDKESFYVRNGSILMCNFCDCRLEHDRKDTLHKHVASEAHKKAKERGNKKRQASLQESFVAAKKAKEDKKDFIIDTVQKFLEAGIAPEKLDHPSIRSWMGTYVKGSGDLPCANTIRRKYLPLVGELKVNEIKNAVEGKDVIIICDETTDKAGNCVFNILFRLLEPGSSQEVFLAASVVLDCADGKNCAQATISTLQKYDVSYDNCVAFITDSARYMTKCFATLSGLMDNLLHVQCWAHKTNLVGQLWQNNLEELNTAVSKVKSAFLNTRKRKHKYLEFLRQKYEPGSRKITLFPMPVLTRWNSWFHSVTYLADHLADILEFMDELSAENAGVSFLKNMTPELTLTTQMQATFVAENCVAMVELIDVLEGNSYPTAHLLNARLDILSTKLTLLSNGVFSEGLERKLSKMVPTKKATLVQQFKLVAQISQTKLANLRASDPARLAFHSVGKLFHPSNISRMNVVNSQADMKKLVVDLPGSKIDFPEFLEGYIKLKDLILEEQGKPDTDHVDVCQILCSIKSEYPAFATKALKAIWLPTSSVDAERSFSKYSVVVTDRRRNLKPENVEIVTMVAFK